MTALAATYSRYPVEFASGSGCVLVDADGTEYLDFLAGIAVCSLGHSHPDVVRVVQQSVGTLDHLFSGMLSHPVVDLSRRLADQLSREVYDRVLSQVR